MVLPHELLSDLRLKDLRELGNSRKKCKPYRMITECLVPPPK